MNPRRPHWSSFSARALQPAQGLMPTADVYRLIAVPSFIFFPSHLSLVVSFTGIKLSAAKPRPGSGFGAIGFVAGPLRLTSADDAYSRDNENESGVEVALSGGAIPENEGAVGSHKLWRASGSNRRVDIDGFHFLGLDGDRGQAGFRPVRQSKDRRYREVLADGVASELQLTHPTGFRRPVGDGGLLIGGDGRRWYWVLLRLGRASGCLGGSTLGNKQR
jgi:hypothetical protein